MEPGTWINGTSSAHEHEGCPRSNQSDVYGLFVQNRSGDRIL